MRQVPPRLPDFLLRLLVPGGWGDILAGDLCEEYVHFVRPSRGKFSADLWFWRQALLSVPAGFKAHRVYKTAEATKRHQPLLSDRGSWAATFAQDLIYAARGLRSRPGFAAVALITLALGIGANTAVFSVVNGVVLRPLPYRQPDRIVRVWPDRMFPFNLESGLTFREQSRAYEEFSLFGRGLFTLAGDGEPEIVRGAWVLSNHFTMLGTPPALGRGFLPEDGREGAEHVVVLATGLWRRRFGSDPSVIGRYIEVSGVSRQVVGVMASDHQPLETDWLLWAPVQVSNATLESGRSMAGAGRLKPDVSVDAAQVESRQFYASYLAAIGESASSEEIAGLSVVPIRDWILGDSRSQLLILLGAVVLLVLIASANIANLLLAQGGARRREIAVRQALGASRGRVLRQLLTESSLLGLLGGAAGLCLSSLLLLYGTPLLPPDLPRSDGIGLDWHVLTFALVLSLGSSMLFGVVPAVRATGTGVYGTLGQGSHGSQGTRQLRLNHGLVAAEVALAMVLVVGAGLMLRTLWTLRNVDPGFESEGVLTLRVSPPASLDTSADILSFHDQVISAVGATPTVVSVGAIQFLPMRPGGWWSAYHVEGEAEPENPSLAMRVVSGHYFTTMGIELQSGREFANSDRDADGRSVVINEMLARAAFPGREPVGRQILLGVDDPQSYTVIGVVAEVSQTDLRTPSFPEAYLPLSQRPWRSMFYTVKVEGNPALAANSVRSAVWSVHEEAPISSVSPLSSVVGNTVASDRLFTWLLSAFGTLALLLGSVGVYGVMSHVVSQRNREIGIRMAVGAAENQVLWATVTGGMIPVAVGLAVGMASALASSRVLTSTLFGVTHTDPLTLAIVPMVLGFAALLALYGPARRASRLDPMRVLREE